MTFQIVKMMIYLLLLVFHCINGLLVFEAEKALVSTNDSVKLICKSSSKSLQITKGLENVGSFESVFNQLRNNDNTRWNITGSSIGMVLVLNVTVLRFLARDAGLYTCKVNGTFTATAEVKMAVGVSFVSLTPTFDPVHVQENITRQFQCVTSEARPYASVSWFKGGVNITSYATSTTMNDITTSTLNMTPVRSDQDSKLYCSARNGGSVVNSTKQPQIEVLYTPSKPTCEYMANAISKPLKIKEGATFSISCSSSGNPQPTFSWKYPGASNATELAPIQIKRINDGIFTVTASNRLEPSGLPPIQVSDYTLINVTVLYGAVIAKFSIGRTPNTIGTITQGDLWEARCVVDSNPGANITLFRNDKDVHKMDNSLELTFSKTAQCEIDIGNYTCTASNILNIHPSSKHLQLFINCSPRLIPNTSQQTTVVTNTNVSATFTFNVAAYPRPKIHDITWTKIDDEKHTAVKILNDANIKMDVSIDGLQTNLTFVSVRPSDYGLYNVTVKNSLGKISQQFLLKAQEKPHPPTTVEGEPISEQKIFVKWKPGFDGGLPQIFVLEIKTADETTPKELRANSDLTNMTINGLKAGTKYLIQMFAKNDLGRSTYSNAIEVVTLLETGSPTLAPIVGGAVGGLAGAGLIVGVVYLIVVLRRKKVRTQDDSHVLTSTKRSGTSTSETNPRTSDEDVLTDEVENPLYGGGDSVIQTKNIAERHSISSEVKMERSGDIYAVVDKKKKRMEKTKKKVQKREEIYENSGTSANAREGFDNSELKRMEQGKSGNSVQKNVDKDGLVYADIVFANPPKGQTAPVINCRDDMTEYAEVDLMKKANPLPESDNENKK